MLMVGRVQPPGWPAHACLQHAGDRVAVLALPEQKGKVQSLGEAYALCASTSGRCTQRPSTTKPAFNTRPTSACCSLSLKRPAPHDAACSAAAPLMSSCHRHIRGCPAQHARWTWMVCSTTTGSVSRLAARTIPSRWVSTSLHPQAGHEHRCCFCLRAPTPPWTLDPASCNASGSETGVAAPGPMSHSAGIVAAVTAACCILLQHVQAMLHWSPGVTLHGLSATL